MQGIGEEILVSSLEAERLIAAHDGEVALLWLYLRQNPGGDLEDAARALCRTRAELEAAAEKLNRLRLPNIAAPAAPRNAAQGGPIPLPADELPDYTAKDLAQRSRDDPRFAEIVREAQRALGRILSTGDLKKLFGLYDYLALPPEVLMMLLNYCVSIYPPGNPPSMRQIEKEGYAWANREILTLERAETYIAQNHRRRDEIGRMARLMDISGRAPSATESKYIGQWLDMGFGEELIGLAYERTVANTGGLKLGYMNGILKSWHEKGLHTPEDVRDRDGRRGAKERGDSAKPPRDLDKLLDALDRI